MSTLNARAPAPGVFARRCGERHAEYSTAERALLVTAARGVPRWRFLSPLGVNPGAGGISEAHEAIKGVGT